VINKKAVLPPGNRAMPICSIQFKSLPTTFATSLRI